MALGNLIVRIGADLTDLNKGLDATDRQLQRLGKKMVSTGKTLSTYVTLPIVGMGAAAIKMGGDFEAGMNQVRALTGATGTQFDDLSAQARELGRTTQFSATQAAEAMGFLGMAGFSATEILDAMPATLQLAAAANLDLGRSADIVSNILTGYGMEVGELGGATDVLVKAMTSANVDLSMLGESFKMVGPIANAVGVEFVDAAAAIALMGNAGIQGEMAGTSLRKIISDLIEPTGEAAKRLEKLGVVSLDSTGNMRPLVDIIADLEAAGMSAGDAMAIFGQRGGPAMAALVSQGSGALRQLSGELRDSAGEAARIAGVQMEGFNGAMKGLKSAFEGLMISIASSGILDFASALAARVTVVIQRASELNPTLIRVAVVVGGLVAAIGPLLIVLGTALKFLPLLKVGLLALSGPIGWTIAAMAALVVAGVALHGNWDTITAKAGEMRDKVTSYVGAMVDGIKERFAFLGRVFDGIKAGTEKVSGFFHSMYMKVVGGSIVPDMVDGIGVNFDRLQSVMVQPADDAAAKVNAAFKSIVNPEALRALDFDVTMDASELYAAVIDAGTDTASKLALLGAASEAYNGGLEQQIEAARRAKTVQDALTAALGDARRQQMLVSLAIGETALTSRNASASLAVHSTALVGNAAQLDMLKANVERTGQTIFNMQHPIEAGASRFQQAMGAVSGAGNGLMSHLGQLGGAAMGVISKFTPMGLATEVIGKVMEHLQPAVAALEPIITILAKALAAGLMPVLKALFPVFKLVAMAATFVGEVFFRVAQGISWALGQLIKGIGKLIDKIPGVSGKGLINAGESMISTSKGFGQAASDLGDARREIKALTWPEEAQEAAAATTEAIMGGTAATEAAVVAIREETGVITALLEVARTIAANTKGTWGAVEEMTAQNNARISVAQSAAANRASSPNYMGITGADLLARLVEEIAKRQRRGGTNPLMSTSYL